jgi:hypothetical protein
MPTQPPELPAGKVNTTDPDSRPIPIGFGFVQGYNAQAPVNEQHIVLAAETTNTSTDFSQLDPMVTATLDELERAGIDQLPETVAADAGYWNEQHMDEIVADKHIPVLVALDKGTRGTPKRWLNSARASWMRSVLGSEHGQQRYRKRKQIVEPLLGNTKHNSGVYRFHRRGRTKVPRVAIADDDPQPQQGSPPPARRHGGLNRPPPGHSAPHHEHQSQRRTHRRHPGLVEPTLSDSLRPLRKRAGGLVLMLFERTKQRFRASSEVLVGGMARRIRGCWMRLGSWGIGLSCWCGRGWRCGGGMGWRCAPRCCAP